MKYNLQENKVFFGNLEVADCTNRQCAEQVYLALDHLHNHSETSMLEKMQEFQKFSLETFKDATAESCLIHLQKELNELIAAETISNRMEESVDIVNCVLSYLAHIGVTAHGFFYSYKEKFEVLKTHVHGQKVRTILINTLKNIINIMPKTKAIESVLHDWVHELTFQMQALLLTAMRGPDENNKFNAAKGIIRYLRGVIIKPAGNWKGFNDNDFMWGDYNNAADIFKDYCQKFWQDHDEYPHHFIMHLIHCGEVVGYKHPDLIIREYWNEFYLDACDAFHMTAETEEQMDKRLNDFNQGYYGAI